MGANVRSNGREDIAGASVGWLGLVHARGRAGDTVQTQTG